MTPSGIYPLETVYFHCWFHIQKLRSSSFPFWYILKNTFSPGLRYLLIGIFIDVRAFRSGSMLLNTDLIFLANINSTGYIPNLVFFIRLLPSDFLRALLSVSTKRSACPFELGWYGSVVMYCICKDSQKNFNSLDVNCVPFKKRHIREFFFT